MKTKWIIALSVLVALTATGIYGYKEFNRKPKSASELPADFRLQAKDLLKEFVASENESNQKYLSKTLAITGLVNSVEKDGENNIVFVFKDEISNAIRCSIDSTFSLQNPNNYQSKKITIKGICAGINTNELGLGSDIILNRCVIDNQ